MLYKCMLRDSGEQDMLGWVDDEQRLETTLIQSKITSWVKSFWLIRLRAGVTNMPWAV